MYKKFFGFKERPFQLVPNPEYLFLSKSHEEALAHLTFAAIQGDGFVEITGEVGTGKTTLCRVFLENLDADTEAAYIFNPRLDALQLLKAINDEFGLPSQADNTKDLIDCLNAFLMHKKSEGKKVILLIDEAQNLSKPVLEQLRLLSNLETTTSKLIQIILVGQPELADMLDSIELRQLAQRVTLTAHLVPLTFRETCSYVLHRLQVASWQQPRARFTGAALRAIYRYSCGTPRLVNIACSRCLLTAYGLGRYRITRQIARKSIRELSTRGCSPRYRSKKMLWLALLAVVLAAAMSLVFVFSGRLPDRRRSGAAPAAAGTAVQRFAVRMPPEKAPPKPDVQAHRAPSQASLQTIVETLDEQTSRRSALAAVLHLWQPEHIRIPAPEKVSDEVFFRRSARLNGLSTLRISTNFGLVRRLDLPAVITLSAPAAKRPVYVAVVQLTEKSMTIVAGPEKVLLLVSMDTFHPFWRKEAFVFWKNADGLAQHLALNAADPSVATLKRLLAKIGYAGLDSGPVFDAETSHAILQIQRRAGLKTNGVLDPIVSILIYNRAKTFFIPHIVSGKGAPMPQRLPEPPHGGAASQQ